MFGKKSLALVFTWSAYFSDDADAYADNLCNKIELPDLTHSKDRIGSRNAES